MKRVDKQTVNTYDVGPDERLRPSVVLDYFQETAQRQLEELGIGLEYMGKKHYAWILVKYEITFNAYPRAGEELTLTTEPVGFRGFEAYRNFELKRGEEVLVEAKSVWVLINTETGKLMRINNIEEITGKLGEGSQVYKIGRLKKIESGTMQKEFDVRYDDIDINKHVNNARYLIWAIEALPPEVLRAGQIKEISIVYKEQSFYGERVQVISEKTKKGYRIDIMRDGTLLTQVELVLENRKKDLEF